MNEKTEKDGTGKLQNSAGIAKQRATLPRLAHRHLQTLIVPPEPSLLRPAIRLGADRTVRLALHDLPISEYIGDHLSFFVAGTLYYSYYCTAKCRVPSDRDSLQKKLIRALPYGAAEFLLGISVFNS